jgi:hypothetical protein
VVFLDFLAGGGKGCFFLAGGGKGCLFLVGGGNGGNGCLEQGLEVRAMDVPPFCFGGGNAFFVVGGLCIFSILREAHLNRLNSF